MALILKDEADYANNHGGLGPQHSKVNMILCNDSFNVNGATACGREAVKDNVAALIGFSQFDTAFLSLLNANHIVRMGGNLETGDNQSSETFIEIPGPFLGWGPLELAASECKKVVWLHNTSLTGPLKADDKAFYQSAFTAAGNPNGLAAIVSIPQTTDLTPFLVQAERSNPDCIYTDGYTSGLEQLIHAETAQGVLGKYGIYTDEPGTLSTAFLKANATQTEGWKTMSFYQIPSQNAAWAAYVTRMAAYSNLDPYRSQLTDTAEQQSEVAWQTIVNATKGIQGAITGATLTQALSTSCDLSTNGLTPNVNFCKTNTNPGIQRMFYPSLTAQIVHGGQLTPYKGGDYTDILTTWQKGGSVPVPASLGGGS